MSTTQEAERIGYALSKQVADMERGFDITTSYGPLHIEAEESAPFIRLAEKLLRKKLAVLAREAEQSQAVRA